MHPLSTFISNLLGEPVRNWPSFQQTTLLALHQSTGTFLGSAALVLQVAVAVYALWLSRVFGTRRAGWALFGAFVLMMLMHLTRAITPAVDAPPFLLQPELAFLCISLLILVGLNRLAAAYRQAQTAVGPARQIRHELESRVAER